MTKFKRVLSGDDVLTLAERTFSFDVEGHIREIERFAEELERAVLKSLPLQTSSAIRGDSYAGVYVWAGNENLVQHIPKVLAQTANDPQGMLGAVAAKCIQELKRFSELQSHEIQALRNQDPLQPAANWLCEAIAECMVADIQSALRIGYNRAQRLHANGISFLRSKRTTAGARHEND